MDSPLMNAKQAAVEVPVWERAHKTLDTISDDMRARLAEIEHTQARLAGEEDAIRNVLQRISAPIPMPPQPSSGYGAIVPNRY